MQFVGKVISSVSEFYRDINPSTLSGAIDVVVVEDVESGELTCSPFHVRFGKLQLLRPQEKAVELKINGMSVGEELKMKVGEAGETFFVLSREEMGMGSSDLPLEYLTSPLVGPETPGPLDSIEEFKLATANVTNNSLNLSATNSSNASLPLNSPEWKWEWGDLPIKKSESVDDNNLGGTVPNSIDIPNVPNTISTPIISSLPEVSSIVPNIPTIELYEYLTDKEYLIKSNEILSRLPPRSMITRIYRIDRGLHFHSPEAWPEQLNLILNESFRVLESDFLMNPNLVIEESSRLVYQFSWENKRVLLGGSVGAAVVFYAQTYARMLPMEILCKLAEVAAIRMAKKKFNKSLLLEGEEGDVAGASAGAGVVEAEVDASMSAANEDLNVNLSKGKEAEDSIESTNPLHPDSGTKGSSTWRSWWNRSSVTNNPITQPNTTDQSTNIPSSSPSGSPKLISKPATLSDLINGEEGLLVDGVGRESPVKRIIQRATSVVSINTMTMDVGDDISASTMDNNNASLIDNINTSTVDNNNASLVDNTTVDSYDSTTIDSVETNVNISLSGDASSINIPGPTLHVPPSSPTGSTKKSSGQFIKSLRLPSHLLKKLNLNLGVNTITYTVNTRLQGTASCQSRIFLWRSDSRVVISDIDGTITKSDALGHLFTMVGKDWTHVGVAQLYSKIAKNGYEFLYLTSRAIGQAASTRGYLKAVEQDRLQLPDGPVIMSPDRLFTALHREVIQRRPDEFKIACLRDIQKLFVPDEEEVSMMGSGMISSSEDEYSGFINNVKSKRSTLGPSQVNYNNDLSSLSTSSQVNLHQNPFYAGFGNRPTDTKSYKAVGISASRIFLINPAGDLKLDKLTFYTPYSASSYSKLTEEVDKVFPPLKSFCSLTRVAGDEAFTDLQYWHGQGGDVRMDLVQQALGSISARGKSTILTDLNGKPVSPITLQKQMASTSSINSSGVAKNSTNDLVFALPSSSIISAPSVNKNKSGEEADSEDENRDESDDSEGDEMDSFPFI